MENHRNIAADIDTENLAFTSSVKAKLSTLSHFPETALEWLMIEHYQFSLRNTKLLAQAAETAKLFENLAVNGELIRNLNEESGHAKMYKRALHDIGSDVEKRKPFPETELFLDTVQSLIATEPSRMLGTMYATETAAIFEHEVFRDVSHEVIRRRSLPWEGSGLKHFHDMHLSGVEQSHKDELGIFLQNVPIGGASQGPTEGATIDAERAREGAHLAIKAMTVWWDHLLARVNEKRSAA
jgi:hypothetical protein